MTPPGKICSKKYLGRTRVNVDSIQVFTVYESMSVKVAPFVFHKPVDKRM